MNTIDASLRNTKTSGEVNKLRSEGNVPGIVYGCLLYTSDAADE